MNGKVCNKCHTFKAYDHFFKKKGNSDGYRHDCKICRKAYEDEWREKNREKDLEKKRLYYRENKERILERKKSYCKENRDKIYASNLKRKSLKHNVKFKSFQRKELLDRDNWECQACAKWVHDVNTGDWDNEHKAHIDHVIPISKGGDSTLNNLRILCRTCNLSKYNKLEIS